jgi:hypothetical protein
LIASILDLFARMKPEHSTEAPEDYMPRVTRERVAHRQPVKPPCF